MPQNNENDNPGITTGELKSEGAISEPPIDKMSLEDLRKERSVLKQEVQEKYKIYARDPENLYKFKDISAIVNRWQKKINNLVASNSDLVDKAVQQGNFLELKLQEIKKYDLGENKSNLRVENIGEFTKKLEKIQSELKTNPLLTPSNGKLVDMVITYTKTEQKLAKVNEVMRNKEDKIEKIAAPIKDSLDQGKNFNATSKLKNENRGKRKSSVTFKL